MRWRKFRSSVSSGSRARPDHDLEKKLGASDCMVTLDQIKESCGRPAVQVTMLRKCWTERGMPFSTRTSDGFKPCTGKGRECDRPNMHRLWRTRIAMDETNLAAQANGLVRDFKDHAVGSDVLRDKPEGFVYLLHAASRPVRVEIAPVFGARTSLRHDGAMAIFRICVVRGGVTMEVVLPTSC